MGTVSDNVIIALLRRMGGPQYLEWDELQGAESPQISREGEYLVVRTARKKKQRPGLPGADKEKGTHRTDTKTNVTDRDKSTERSRKK